MEKCRNFRFYVRATQEQVDLGPKLGSALDLGDGQKETPLGRLQEVVRVDRPGGYTLARHQLAQTVVRSDALQILPIQDRVNRHVSRGARAPKVDAGKREIRRRGLKLPRDPAAVKDE